MGNVVKLKLITTLLFLVACGGSVAEEVAWTRAHDGNSEGIGGTVDETTVDARHELPPHPTSPMALRSL